MLDYADLEVTSKLVIGQMKVRSWVEKYYMSIN